MELECTEEMREEIKEMLQEVSPMLLMSLKDALSFIKQSGQLPTEMADPFNDWIKEHFGGEVRFFGQRSVAVKWTLKLPGFDEVVGEFLEC